MSKKNQSSAPKPRLVAKDGTKTTAQIEPKVAKKKTTDLMPPLPKMPSAARTRKPKPMVACACGCGGETQGTWVPGHDAYVKGWALRVNRKLVKIEDTPEPQREAIKKMQKVLAAREKEAKTAEQTTSTEPAAASNE